MVGEAAAAAAATTTTVRSSLFREEEGEEEEIRMKKPNPDTSADGLLRTRLLMGKVRYSTHEEGPTMGSVSLGTKRYFRMRAS
ncbi:hypothetical protein HPB50_007134 [Hyalomma asiaticum]|uniref:Uncharacterized protein n=1 Tax=Hyalomma asiaticum TaxID=266040 RepID=A0ACB7RVZ7_HYAAI|nr:hypothetical protein HPB50_007134 [Hyalomma asiaticum]